jgi:hypothetical protein
MRKSAFKAFWARFGAVQIDSGRLDYVRRCKHRKNNSAGFVVTNAALSGLMVLQLCSQGSHVVW